MKINKLFKVVFMFLIVMFVASCGSDNNKVKSITPEIDSYLTYELTTYMGNDISYHLSENEIAYVKQEMPYFYESKYYTADITRTPIVELTITTIDSKLEFICALDSNDNRCFMLNINSVSYNIKVSKEFKEEHNFFGVLYSLAEEVYYNKI